MDLNWLWDLSEWAQVLLQLSIGELYNDFCCPLVTYNLCTGRKSG